MKYMSFFKRFKSLFEMTSRQRQARSRVGTSFTILDLVNTTRTNNIFLFEKQEHDNPNPTRATIAI